MKITNRLRRAGVTALAAAALAGCKDGFFFDPAPGRITPVVVRLAHVPGAAPEGVGPRGTESPQAAGPADAFDKADGALVVLTSDAKELFNQRVPLEAAGSDKKVSFNVELPPGSTVQASLQLTLLRGQDVLFTGSTTTQLTPGQSAEVTLPLAGVVNALALNAASVTLRILGGTFRLAARGLFASGDTLGAVNATYRALGSAVSVAADGTVTAVSNGIAGVEAAYLGKADTATVTVDDRCVPAPLPAFGTPLGGVLDDLDCPLPNSDRVGDWYRFKLTQATAVRFSLASQAYVPRWSLFEEKGPGRGFDFDGLVRAHQLDGTPGFEAVVLPPGDYRLYLYAATGVAKPRGSYTFSSQVVTDDNDFPCPADDGKGTLWITPGYRGDQDLGGGCTGNDPLGQVNQDRFGVYLEPGVEYVFRTSSPGGLSPEIFLFYPTKVAEAKGSSLVSHELRYKTPADRPGWHGLTVVAAPGAAAGPYFVSFVEAGKDVDPCAPTSIALIGTRSGTLDYRKQCYFQGLNASEYRTFTFAKETSFQVGLTSAKPANWGVVEATGSIESRLRYVTGSNVRPAVATLPAGTYALFVSAGPGNLGDWSLTAGAVSPDLDVGCGVDVHIVAGFYGKQTLNAACVEAGGRNQDAYRVFLAGGQYSVNVVGGTLPTSLAVVGPAGDILAVDQPAPEASAPVRVVGPAASNLATFTVPSTNWYYVFVTGASPGAAGTYAFHLTKGGPNTGGSLTGAVTADGSPLSGVTVTLSGSASRSASTDAAGNYSFAGLPMGTYTVSVSGLPGNVALNPASRSFILDAPDMAVRHDFPGTFQANGVVRGTVVHNLVGLAGVTVTLSGASSATATTDGAGAYAFSGLPDGAYSVTVSGFMAAAYVFTARTAATTVVNGGTSSVNFSGASAGQPSFTVTVVVLSDPNGHEASIQETTTNLFLVQIFNGNLVSIFAVVPGTRWVNVSGSVNPNGSFNLTGRGTVAGIPNIDVIFAGSFSHDGTKVTGVTGTLTMGPGTQLPADGSGNHNPATYTVTATRVP